MLAGLPLIWHQWDGECMHSGLGLQQECFNDRCESQGGLVLIVP
jgi:hypothetical protein